MSQGTTPGGSCFARLVRFRIGPASTLVHTLNLIGND